MESAGIIFPKQLEAIPAIIHELETMQTAISNENRHIQDSVRREINSRIHTLISEMQQIQNAPDEIDHASIS
ncbi:MAG: hypothetical protein H0X30_25590 [Anaerolineae bacterium]|nr:hypothetical protein [Anaerolineae bacterium]